MANLEGNSFASKTKKAEEPKVKQVATTAKVKKQSELSKFGKNLVSDDAANVKERLITDILIPKFKDLIVGSIKYAADFIFYGGRGTDSYSKSSSGPKTVSYSSLYSQQYNNYQPQKPRNSVYEVGDVTFDTRAEAEDVLFALRDALNRYGVVSVADYYDTFGGAHDFTANKYGWRDLSTADVISVRGRYSITLPRAVPIE